MKRAILIATMLACASPAEAGKLRWLTDAADAAKFDGVARALPNEPWLRQADGTYLDLAVVPDGDGTRLMGKAEDGSLVEFTAEQVEEVMGLVADGVLSLPTDEEVAATSEPKTDTPDWVINAILVAVGLFVLWQAWQFVKGTIAAGKRISGWFRRG